MEAMNAIRRNAKGPLGKKMVITMNNSFSKSTDSSRKDSAVVTTMPERNVIIPGTAGTGEFSRVVFRSSLGDSLSASQVDSAYSNELRKAKIKVGHIIFSRPVIQSPGNFTDSVNKNALHTNYVIVGLSNPVAYQAQLGSPFNYILGKITYPILVSILLITLTTVSFIFLYRNLLAQQRLTNIKNDFISNITHELKTPIATVNVAIEALKSFNAMDNPARTKEYLDISSAELQRLSLLVDKVLKLSMFENKDVDLKRETFSLKQVIDEVLQTMQLQFDKAKASVSFHTEGERFMVEADKLHITSVPGAARRYT
jgi:K+-sensing histidine kinase KdpD